jgi:hypothetical protein
MWEVLAQLSNMECEVFSGTELMQLQLTVEICKVNRLCLPQLRGILFGIEFAQLFCCAPSWFSGDSSTSNGGLD